MAIRRFVVVVLLWLLASCQAALPKGAEAWSLSGDALYAPKLSDALRTEREANLRAAREQIQVVARCRCRPLC